MSRAAPLPGTYDGFGGGDVDSVEGATHLVVGTNDENRAKRTEKYLSAILLGVKIVNGGWVDACLGAQHRVPEGDYLVVGDSIGGRLPTVVIRGDSRRPIFAGRRFYMNESLGDKFTAIVEKLIRHGGGEIVEGQQFSRGTSPRLRDVYTIVDAQRPSSGNDKENRTGPVLDKTWVMDSIASGSLMPHTEYKFSF